MKDIEIAERMARTAKSARDRGYEFDLSFDTFKKLLTSTHCFITGVKLTTEGDDKITKDNYLTLERIDNSKGYIEGNVIACSNYINAKKGDLTVEEIKMIYEAMKKKGLIDD